MLSVLFSPAVIGHLHGSRGSSPNLYVHTEESEDSCLSCEVISGNSEGES